MNTTSTPSTANVHNDAPGDNEPVVLDEAFAELPEVSRRVDKPVNRQPKQAPARRDYAAESRQMITQIGAQLKAIEQQRARLVRLLEELDVSGS
ncbi:MAG: hypothetical protein ACR2NU_10525 [Aeoliella sp.]